MVACGCGCLLGYTIVVALKLAGIAPHFTWLGIIAIVPWAFGGIGVGIVVPAWFPRYPVAALVIGCLSWMVIFAAVVAVADRVGW
jgi:hypothetical protein